MAGTMTVKMLATLTSLGHVPIMNTTYTVTGVDEYSSRYSELAATTAMSLDIGEINTVDLVVVHLVSGGSTAATGLEIHLASATWADQDYNLVLLSGEIIAFRPIISTLSVKNMNSSTATVEYFIIGQGT